MLFQKPVPMCAVTQTSCKTSVCWTILLETFKSTLSMFLFPLRSNDMERKVSVVLAICWCHHCLRINIRALKGRNKLNVLPLVTTETEALNGVVGLNSLEYSDLFSSDYIFRRSFRVFNDVLTVDILLFSVHFTWPEITMRLNNILSFKPNDREREREKK